MRKTPSTIAVVTAGWNPAADDPLIEHTQGRPKALLPIAGRPMIAHVVHALARSQYIDAVIIVGLDPAAAPFDTPVEYLPDAGGMIDNARAGIDHALARHPQADAVLLCSSDVPTITPAIVDDFIQDCWCTDHDIYYSIVERSVMEARFPQSQRSYLHLREGDFAGGDLLLLRRLTTHDHDALMRKLAAARKSVLRQAMMLGPSIFMRYVTRRLTLPAIEKRAVELFGMRVRALSCPHAEVGMDVDKPVQLRIVRADLAAHARQS